ncbi:MAG: inosine/xanthosine triphosphatase [Anaerolineae bacterium]
MKIAIGSLNPVKLAAAESVLQQLYPEAHFEAVGVASGVSAQPKGDQETRTGAVNRARAARQKTAADLAIGLEGGLIETEFGLMTSAWCAVVDSEGRLGIGGGAHMMLPPQTEVWLRAGMELGEAMDRLTGLHNTKHDNGAIGILTAGLETRTSAYAHILHLALAPFRSPYFRQERES